MTRVCNACKANVNINGSETDCIYHRNKFYHMDCFVEYAEKKANSKSKYASDWQIALSNIEPLKRETKKVLEQSIYREKLNWHLLSSYDIAVVPKKIWTFVSDIGNGKYKGSSCKAVSVKELYTMWLDYDKELKDIHKWKASKESSFGGVNVILYDIAILMNKYPEWRKKQAKRKVENKKENNTVEINYNSMKIEREVADENDINSLLDEVF